VDYSGKELLILKNVYRKQFEEYDDHAMGEVMSSCNTAYEVMVKCNEQHDMMLKIPSIAEDMTSFLISINKCVNLMPFPYILAIVRDEKNIIILDRKFIFLFAAYAVDGGDFFDLLGVDRFILYDKSHENERGIPIFSRAILDNIHKQSLLGLDIVMPSDMAINTEYMNSRCNVGDKLKDIDVSIEIAIRRTIIDNRGGVSISKLTQRIITIE